jgi:hypothetical protein
VVVAVQVEDVQVVGLQPRQDGIGLLDQPAARVVALVDVLADRIAQLAGQHPVLPLAGQQLAHVFLGLPLVVDVGGVDEVEPVLAGRGHDARRVLKRRLLAEHHGAQAEGGDFEVAVSEAAVLHGHLCAE